MSSLRISLFGLANCLLLASGLGAEPLSSGWAIDACISIFAKPEDRGLYLDNLRNAQIAWVRERGPVPTLAEVKAGGVNVVGFTSFALKPEQKNNQLPEDLLAVFRAAEAMQRKHGTHVDAWEMVGEPDLGYCTDLPDRVAAFQKAVYLGIKRGALDSGAGRLGLGDRVAEAVPLEKEGGDVDGGQLTVDSAGASTGAGDLDGSLSDGRKPDGSLPTGHRLPATGKPAPLVLMGALGNTPGPWLERAAQNALLEYTDAYNFHFYGRAEDFTDAINAHAEFVRHDSERQQSRANISPRPSRNGAVGQPAERTKPGKRLGGSLQEQVEKTSEARRRAPALHLSSNVSAEPSTDLPLWITEAGEDAVDPDDFLNAARRQRQAEFTVSTARQALDHPQVAMFMPFVLVWNGRPWAMTLAADKPLPAWEAYARFTRENPWPDRVLARVPVAPNPVVVQWLPDNRTTVPHKVSGTYRFRGNEPIIGVITLYNFSETEVSGELHREPTKSVAMDSGRWPVDGPLLRIPAMGKVSVPVTITPNRAGYFSEFLRYDFVDETGRVSPLSFGVERAPRAEDFVAKAIQLKARSELRSTRSTSLAAPALAESGRDTANGRDLIEVKGGRPVEAGWRIGFSPGLQNRGPVRHPMFAEYTVSSASGAWVGINGLQLFTATPAHDLLPSTTPSTVRRLPSTDLTAWTNEIQNDPLKPTMAVARVRGLPKSGFLYLKTDRPMGPDAKVRVDLLDRQGQRFTIWENLGVSYFGPRHEAWLNLADFHQYSWGRVTNDPRLHPERVQEIQLRFYFRKLNHPLTVSLEIREAK